MMSNQAKNAIFDNSVNTFFSHTMICINSVFIPSISGYNIVLWKIFLELWDSPISVGGFMICGFYIYLPFIPS